MGVEKKHLSLKKLNQPKVDFLIYNGENGEKVTRTGGNEKSTAEVAHSTLLSSEAKESGQTVVFC